LLALSSPDDTGDSITAAGGPRTVATEIF
jgi:hypothetical protein